MDVTDYLPMYRMSAKELSMKIMEDVYAATGITAACGIGTNLYLAKIAVGISFSLAATVILALAITIPTFLINGLEGFDAPIQSFAPLESWAMTAGERLLIMMAMGFWQRSCIARPEC